MALLRHGGMDRVFAAACAPSRLASLLRAFTFGHVRQLDAVASRFLTGLAERTPVAAGLAERTPVAAWLAERTPVAAWLATRC